jgi:Thiolase, N-terminal domain/Transposase DDE domain group 1
MKDVAVVAYCRTGIARAIRGALNQTHGIPMTAHVLHHAVERAGIDPTEVQDVVVGCGLPEGATGHNVARNAALEAGFGDTVPGMTVNRYCGSGLSAASIVNLANFLRTLALPGEVERWSLTSLREKVVKIGAKVIAHGRYAIFQMAEVAVPRELFGRILERIARLRPPDPAPC